MFERFTKEARALVKQSMEEARLVGSPHIEAEHLLLAMADDPLLVEAGLDHDGIIRALDAEEARSLAVVGVSIADYELPERTTRGPDPTFATSAKLALARSVKLADGQKRLLGRHILLGVLDARAGTVVRALAIAGIDKAELSEQVKATLA